MGALSHGSPFKKDRPPSPSSTRLMTRAGGKRTNGKVAAALMEKAKTGDPFAKTPEIHKLEILADKLPK
jgi:hypothetical protein